MEKSGDFGTLFYGKVLALSDEDNPGKIKVKLRGIYESGHDEVWADVLTAYGDSGYGIRVIPEVDSEVVVGFPGGAREVPIVLGCVYTTADEKPEDFSEEENLVKMFRTKGGHVIIADDTEDKAKLTVKTPSGLTIALDDENKLISLSDSEGNNSISCDCGGGTVTISAKSSISLKIGDNEVFSADSSSVNVSGGKVSVSADNQLVFDSAQTKSSSQTLDISASAQGSISSDGIMQVKGAMLKLNG